MAFIDEELDICPAYGWVGGPGFDTRIKRLKNNHERRNANASRELQNFILPFLNIEHIAYARELADFFRVCRGSLHSFKVKDWIDYAAASEPLGSAPAGSSAVQLKRVHVRGAYTYVRDITKPVLGAVIYENGTPKAGTLDTLTGLFTPADPWTPGAAITWSGEFRIPVRFNNDQLSASIDNVRGNGRAINLSVELIEVVGE